MYSQPTATHSTVHLLSTRKSKRVHCCVSGKHICKLPLSYFKIYERLCECVRDIVGQENKRTRECNKGKNKKQMWCMELLLHCEAGCVSLVSPCGSRWWSLRPASGLFHTHTYIHTQTDTHKRIPPSLPTTNIVSPLFHPRPLPFVLSSLISLSVTWTFQQNEAFLMCIYVTGPLTGTFRFPINIISISVLSGWSICIVMYVWINVLHRLTGSS